MNDKAPEGLAIGITRPADGVVLIVLAGEADILSSADLSGAVSGLDGSLPAHVVFDVGGLTFMDSSGVNALVQAVRTIEGRGGTAAVTAPSPQVQRVFDIIGIAQVIAIVTDRDAALVPPSPPADRAGLADAG